MPAPTTDRLFIPDDAQCSVIEAPADEFVLVTAPPGAGKTAVACARIVELTRRGVEASSIMMLSFTRVAVGVFRNRIEALAENLEGMHGVEITTLDSSAWRILKGIDEERGIEELFGDFDDNIGRTLIYLREQNPSLMEFLGRFTHLLVDEAQDLTSVRAELVMELIRTMRRQGSGVTVFADPAQAIYGFTCNDGEDGVADREALFLEMLAESELEPRRLSLTKIHRTDKANLNRLFTEARVHLVRPAENARAAYHATRAKIEEHVDGRLEGYFKDHPELHTEDDRLVLYRRRVEVLTDSSFLSSEGIEHRLRLSGFPHRIEPWIGATLGQWTDRLLGQDDFHKLWQEHSDLEAVARSGRTAEEAWGLLTSLRVTRKNRIEMRRLRSLLSRSRPPLEAASPILGHRGPILGTIHAAKGTEAAHVTLMLPPEPVEKTKSDIEEEARVLYVGATRAMQSLITGQGARMGASSLDGSGRAYRRCEKGSAQVEIGREGDLDPISPVARFLMADEDEAIENQQLLASLACHAFELRGYCRAELNYRYVLARSKDELPIASLGKAVNNDMFAIGDALQPRVNPPDFLPYLYSLGCTTVCVPEDHPSLEELQAPFDDSGFFLAPVIKGFSKARFRTRTRQR